MKVGPETQRTQSSAIEMECGHSWPLFFDPPSAKRTGMSALRSFGLFDRLDDRGVTRRSFLGASLFVLSFLSGCETTGTKSTVKRNSSRGEARIAELKLELPPPTKPSAT